MSYARYTHDCPNCHFLGQHEAQDLYFCAQGQRPTVLARQSSMPSDYESGLYGSFSDGALAVARQTAQVKGLLAYPWKQALLLMHANTPAWAREEFMRHTVSLPVRQLAQRLLEGQASADDCEAVFQQSATDVSDVDAFWALVSRFLEVLGADSRQRFEAMLPVTEWSMRYDNVEA